MNFKRLLSTGIITAGLVTAAAQPATAVPQGSVDTDSRIKTLFYNENDVYTVVARTGFQTNIELAANETIDTISIGDAIGWQITPSTRRIFVKPLQKNGVTNLSVITNRRSYQFELVATSAQNNARDHAYVVRFYYPEDNSYAPTETDRSRGSLRPVSPTAIPELPLPPAPVVAPVAPKPLPGDIAAKPVPLDAVSGANDRFNYNYTLTGPEGIAPKKIFDDGKSTFFQITPPGYEELKFAIVRPDGSEVPVMARPDGQGNMVVDQLANKFTIRQGSGLICVFNESMNLPPVPSTRPY